MDNLDKILEGILFLSGDGVDRGVIMEKLNVTPKQLDKAIEVLKKRYDNECGISLITYKDKLQLSGNPKFADEVSVVLNPIRERQLTKATLEVMAIVAYKQPVTRIDVQDIRGTNSDYALQTLLNYKLIEVVGRKDAIGKPLLFGTTDLFLRHFGIDGLNELPDYDDIMKNIEEIKQQNNALYNEFDIPNEEEIPESQPASQTPETLQNTEQNSAMQTDKTSTTQTVQTISEQQNQTNNQNVIQKDSAKIDATDSVDTQSKQTEQKSKDVAETKVDLEQALLAGIDYSLLEENTDIEN